jgi:hypothetical protein
LTKHPFNRPLLGGFLSQQQAHKNQIVAIRAIVKPTNNMETFIHALDWAALGVGTIGTILWAHNGKWAKYAAIWWLASSILWIWYASLNNLAALGARDLISVSLYVYGGWRWLLAKNHSHADKPQD